MEIDLAAVRADTPGVEHVAHLNNAGAALPPRVVTGTMVARLRDELTAIDGVTVHDKGAVQGGIVTFTVGDLDSRAVSARLRAAGVNTSFTFPEDNHFDGRGLRACVRASAHYYNSEEELDRLLDVVSSL